ncbi:MAG: MarR family winged helix-turn-helix transcriptional regulator [Promethearchaeota archaeon]
MLNENNEKTTKQDIFMSVFHLIKNIEKQFNHIERELLQDQPKIDKSIITPPQLFVLRLLWIEDGFALKFLATAAKCSRSTMTGVVDTMEKNGLVTRVPNPKDGRSTLVKLTALGKNLRRYTLPLDEYMMTHCKNISKEELQMLTLLLKKFSNSLENY